MIIFDLACLHEHAFEGWFKSQQDYDAQLARGILACPECGSYKVRRVPSVLHLSDRTSNPPPTTSAPALDIHSSKLDAYRQLRELVIANSEDVGSSFASEARKIHYHESPERSIRGEASRDDYESLRDEGIEVVAIAQLKNEELN